MFTADSKRWRCEKQGSNIHDIGESPKGEFDIRYDIQKNASELRIPLSCLDTNAITFTYPDSLIKFTFDESGNRVNAELTNEPTVYLYHELDDVINKYHVYRESYEHYIEAQVWEREMLCFFLQRHIHKEL